MEHISTGLAVSNAISKGNCALFVRFVEAIERTDLLVHFNIGKLRVMQFLKRILFSDTFVEKIIVDLFKAEAGARSMPF